MEARVSGQKSAVQGVLAFILEQQRVRELVIREQSDGGGAK